MKDHLVTNQIEIVCPAGSLAAVETAIDCGADTVYVGLQDETNARNFPGLNLTATELIQAAAYAHARNRTLFLAINTYPQAGMQSKWHQAVRTGLQAGVDALIIADIGLLDFVTTHYPGTRVHLSVQATAATAEAIDFYIKHFSIQRVVLPRVLTLQEIISLNSRLSIQTEIFAFGGMCPMAEGRCSLSSYITGQSPNQNGVCSPASHVHYVTNNHKLSTLLNGYAINEFSPDENAGYPTLCKGRFKSAGNTSYLFEDPVSLNALTMLPELHNAGITALKIEGRQRSKAYIRDIVTIFRQALDNFYRSGQRPNVDPSYLCEGQRTTTGAYQKQWR